MAFKEETALDQARILRGDALLTLAALPGKSVDGTEPTITVLAM